MRYKLLSRGNKFVKAIRNQLFTDDELAVAFIYV